jgi:hypothetical protein
VVSAPASPHCTDFSTAVFETAYPAWTEQTDQNLPTLAQTLLVYDQTLGKKVPFTQRVVISRTHSKATAPAILATLLERERA